MVDKGLCIMDKGSSLQSFSLRNWHSFAPVP